MKSYTIALHEQASRQFAWTVTLNGDVLARGSDNIVVAMESAKQAVYNERQEAFKKAEKVQE